jgi:hypothetical protein
MTRTGVILIVVGQVITVAGTVQLPLTVWLSGDPTVDPVGNGILMWLSWALTGLLVVVGAVMVLAGRATGYRRPGGVP